MKKIYLLFSAIIYTFWLIAQPPAGYYDAANGLTGAQLKTALFNIIKNPNVVSYSGLWTAFIDTDKDLYYENNSKVLDMYSENPNGPDPYEFDFGTDQCGTYNSEGDCFNREHSFPASWFNDASPMYSDLFHLYPTDGYVNNKRGNSPFGKVNNPTWTSMNGSKLGANSTPGYSGVVFEPIDEFKGDFARSVFYMVTCYENLVAGWSTSNTCLNGTTYPALAQWALDLYIQWHTNDPVSQKEIDRNNKVYQKQGNRNPFIDHPEWVYAIWGGGSSVANPTNFNASAQSTSSILLSWNLNASNNPVLLAYNTTNTFGVPTGSYTAGQQINGGGTVLYVGSNTSFLHSGLLQQNYYYKIWSNNNGTYSSGVSLVASPLLPEPTNYPTNFTSPQQTSTTIKLTWDDATGSVLPTYYYIRAAVQGQSIPVPVDGVAPVIDNMNMIAAYGDKTVTFENLTPSTTYIFAIFPFNNTGTNTNYKTDGVYPLTTATTTEALTECTTETFTNIPANDQNYYTRTWTGDNGGTWTATQARTDQAIDGRAICFKGYVQSNIVAGGIGTLSAITMYPFGDGTGTLEVYVNGSNVGSLPISQTQQYVSLQNINIGGNVQIKIVSVGSKRAGIDNLSWTCYTPTIEQQVNQKTSVNIFPNPLNRTDNSLYIRFDGEKPQTIIIFDLFGNKIKEFINSSSIIPLQNDFAPGIYVCLIKYENATLIKKLIVK